MYVYNCIFIRYILYMIIIKYENYILIGIVGMNVRQFM